MLAEVGHIFIHSPAAEEFFLSTTTRTITGDKHNFYSDVQEDFIAYRQAGTHMNTRRS